VAVKRRKLRTYGSHSTSSSNSEADDPNDDADIETGFSLRDDEALALELLTS